VPFEHDDGAIVNRPIDKVVTSKSSRSWRHAEHRRQAKRHAVFALENGGLGLHLRDAVRESAAAAIFGTVLAGFADPVAAVRHRQQMRARACDPAQHPARRPG